MKQKIRQLFIHKRYLFLLVFGWCSMASQLYAQKIWQYGFIENNQSLPLKSSRTLSFVTEEGSFMDIDVSKDGKFLLFNLLGDLYTLPVSGGKAKQITRGMEMISKPVWSPDGSRFACISDASGGVCLQLRFPDGRLIKSINLVKTDNLPARRDVIWLPGEKDVLINTLGVINLESGEIGAIPKSLSSFGYFSKVLTVDRAGNFYAVAGDKEYRIKRLSREGKIDSLAANVIFDSQYIERIKISPDCKWAVYPDFCKALPKGAKKAKSSKLLLLNLAASREQVLVDTLNETNLRLFEEGFNFSPDSKNVFIGYGGKIHSINISSLENKIVPFKANIKTELAELVKSQSRVGFDKFNVKYIRNVRKSPSGNQIVFEALGRVYVMNLNSNESHVLSDEGDVQMNPVYSPDGKWIVFVSRNDSGGGFVWKVSSTVGKAVKVIAYSGDYLNPNFSASGDKLVCIKSLDDAQRFVFVDMVSGKSEIKPDSLRFGIRSTVTPQFSADGKHLFFGSYDQKFMQNYTILGRVNLSGEEVVGAGINTKVKFWPQYIERVTLSPDNRYAVFSRFNSLYIKAFDANHLPDTLMNDKQWNKVFRFAVAGVDPWWSADGKKISYSIGNKFYEVSLEKLLAAIALQDDPKIRGVMTSDIQVEPDHVTDINLKMNRSFGQGKIALRNARVITVEDNNVIEKGTVLIKDGRIEAVKSGADVMISADYLVIDCAGKTIIPGLIDVHDHLHLPDGIIFKNHWRLLVNLAFGVTTAVDPSAEDNEFGYGEMVDAGLTLGPRIINSGKPVQDSHLLRAKIDAQDLVSARAAFGGRLVKEYDQESRITRQWTVMAAKHFNMNVTNESNQTDIYKGLSQFKDGSSGVEHQYNWWHEAYGDVKTFVAKSGTWLTPTLTATRAMYEGGAWGGDWFLLNHYKKNPDQRLESFFPASELGWKKEAIEDSLTADFVPIVRRDVDMVKQGLLLPIGGHGDFAAMGMHLELYGMHLGGMSNLEILKSATLNGAKTLGMDRDLGSIKKGKIADLIILDKNPLEDIEQTRSIRYVMKSGFLYDGYLNSVWPLAKPAPSLNRSENKN